MTVYLALDKLAGIPQADGGLIRATNGTVAGLTAAGFGNTDGYRGDRRVSIDETDTDVWDDDCEPGWYWYNGKVQQSKPLTNAQRVAVDISNFKESVEREAREWVQVEAEESFSPSTDSGHAWPGDLLHSLLVPNTRIIFLLLETAKATPSDENIAAYRARVDSFNAIAEDPGVVRISREADRSFWRPKRGGLWAYGYDVDNGRARQDEHGADIRVAVTYPTGETVATWDALAAVRSL